MAHGDVVVKDIADIIVAIAADKTDQEDLGTSSTTAYDRTILGVVYDPQGFGVADGAVGCLMVRGFSSVHVAGAALSVGCTLVQSGTGLTAAKATAGATLVPGAIIGITVQAKTLTTTTTIGTFIDLK